MSEHAILAPSFAPVWGNCSGAVMASVNVPNIDTPESLNGTAAHWVGAECLLTWRDPNSGVSRCANWLGQTAPNGVVIDRDHVEGAQVYVDNVLAVCNEHGALGKMLVEHRVFMPDIHEANWGTLDLCIPLLDKGLIYNWDYKHGHRENSAVGNLQQIDYMKGIVNELKIDSHAEQAITVVFRIVRPFYYHGDGPVSEWRVRLSDLRGYWNQLASKAKEALLTPLMSTGPWCRDCPGLRTCSAARKANHNYLNYANEPYLMDNMSAHDIAVERRIIERGLGVAKERLKALDDELVHLIQGGEPDTGMTLEGKMGRLAWKIPPAQAITIGAQFGANIAKEEVLTPTQSVQEIPAGMRPAFEQVLKSVTQRPAGGLKLIDAKDSMFHRAFKRK